MPARGQGKHQRRRRLEYDSAWLIQNAWQTYKNYDLFNLWYGTGRTYSTGQGSHTIAEGIEKGLEN